MKKILTALVMLALAAMTPTLTACTLPSGCVLVAEDNDHATDPTGDTADWIYDGPSNSWWDQGLVPEGDTAGFVGAALEEDSRVWNATDWGADGRGPWHCAESDGARQTPA